MNNFETPKGTKLPLMNLKGKPYLQVMHRVLWFREEHPDWAIETSVELVDSGLAAIGRASIKDDKGRVLAMGSKMETKQGFGDFLEKSESGAVGRALGLLGYGTQFAVELEEEGRLADSPAPLKTMGKVEPSPDQVSRAMSAAKQFASGAINGDPGMFVVPVGRDKGVEIRDLSKSVIEANIAYWTTQHKAKPLDGNLLNYMNALIQYHQEQLI